MENSNESVGRIRKSETRKEREEKEEVEEEERGGRWRNKD